MRYNRIKIFTPSNIVPERAQNELINPSLSPMLTSTTTKNARRTIISGYDLSQGRDKNK